MQLTVHQLYFTHSSFSGSARERTSKAKSVQGGLSVPVILWFSALKVFPPSFSWCPLPIRLWQLSAQNLSGSGIVSSVFVRPTEPKLSLVPKQRGQKQEPVVENQ